MILVRAAVCRPIVCEKHWYFPRNACENNSGFFVGLFGGECFWRITSRQEYWWVFYIAELTDVTENCSRHAGQMTIINLRRRDSGVVWEGSPPGRYTGRGPCVVKGPQTLEPRLPR